MENNMNYSSLPLAILFICNITTQNIHAMLDPKVLFSTPYASDNKTYKEKKEEFMQANDGSNPQLALDKAIELLHCFDNEKLQLEECDRQLKRLGTDLIKSVSMAHDTALLTVIASSAAALAYGITRKNGALIRHYLAAPAIPATVAVACEVNVAHKKQQIRDLNQETAFNEEKRWLLNALQCLKQTLKQKQTPQHEILDRQLRAELEKQTAKIESIQKHD